MSYDYDFDDDDDDNVGHGGGFAPAPAPDPYDVSGESVERLDLASGDDWTGSPLTVAVSAAGGVVVSSFLQALGSKLGERGAQIVQDAVKRPWWRRRGRARDERDLAAAFLSAVRAIADAQDTEDGVVRLLNARNSAVVLVHGGLPAEAISQFRHLRLTQRELAGRTVLWTADGRTPRGAWRTDPSSGGRYHRGEYVWRDRERRWERV